MQKLKLAVWPYPGAIGVREGEELHVIDRWCYLGTAKNEVEIAELLQAGVPAFDRDTYMLLSKSLQKVDVVVLPRTLEMAG